MEIQTKKFPWLLIFAVILLVGVGLAWGYFSSQSNYSQEQIDTTEREITELRNQLEALRSSETVSAQTAVQALEQIESTEVLWSNVLEDIQKVIPIDLTEKMPVAEFVSYSGAQGGLLSFNAHTNPSSDVEKQLKNIAEVISTFNQSPAFSDAFVPSVSKSVTPEEEIILSFIFNINYIPSSLLLSETTGDSTSTESETTTGGAVPRR